MLYVIQLQHSHLEKKELYLKVYLSLKDLPVSESNRNKNTKTKYGGKGQIAEREQRVEMQANNKKNNLEDKVL